MQIKVTSADFPMVGIRKRRNWPSIRNWVIKNLGVLDAQGGVFAAPGCSEQCGEASYED